MDHVDRALRRREWLDGHDRSDEQKQQCGFHSGPFDGFWTTDFTIHEGQRLHHSPSASPPLQQVDLAGSELAGCHESPLDEAMTTPDVTIRVLTVDDDALVREAYRAFFQRAADLELVGEARNGNEAVESYATLRPDVVLMDLQMPGCSGIEATARICSKWSGACVVALTTFGTREYIVAALRAGAAGYLLKDTGAQNLLAGVRQAVRGDMPMSSSVRRQLVDSLRSDSPIAPEPVDVGLTARESELVGWLAQGLTNYQIGREMFVSEGSVKQYLAHIGDKLGVKSRTQILVRSIQLHIVDPHVLPRGGTAVVS